MYILYRYIPHPHRYRISVYQTGRSVFWSINGNYSTQLFGRSFPPTTLFPTPPPERWKSSIYSMYNICIYLFIYWPVCVCVCVYVRGTPPPTLSPIPRRFGTGWFGADGGRRVFEGGIWWNALPLSSTFDRIHGIMRGPIIYEPNSMWIYKVKVTHLHMLGKHYI